MASGLFWAAVVTLTNLSGFWGRIALGLGEGGCPGGGRWEHGSGVRYLG